MSGPEVSQEAVQAFIAKWQNTPGGAERANYQLFLTGLCSALGLEEPHAAQGGVLGRYQFEGPVPHGSLNGGPGFIDFYRKGAFVLEAKQSQIPEADKNQPELFDPATSAPGSSSGAKYDQLMRRALRQARNYAVNLPGDHPWPPFLILCDVGRAFELYFDWSGNGRGYEFFPDRQDYRITIDRLAEPEVQALFRDLWNNPKALDPRLRAAEVTRGVAQRLADVSKWLEATQRLKAEGLSDYEKSMAVEETSLFLMRILFCMFAEDVGLLPKDSFKNFLAEAVEVQDDQHFQTGLRDLWAIMGDDRPQRWSWALKGNVRYFNGGLFADAKTFVLGSSDRGELLAAARADWKRVEPAIFGTLLEQALTASERAKLGAHYTPRPYVERLVRATIMEVLEAEWETVQGEVEALRGVGGGEAALGPVQAFHERLSGLRILDPACGTGNFLYVSMELLLRLEADVLVLIEQLGGEAEPLVGPQQFYGLELNPRAAVIAELVLWIGWLRWRMANDPDSVPEPVLRKTDTINFGGHAGYDAILRHKPTGEPDTDNPVLADWPEADFIVGNPPFIGKGSNMRRALGDDYVEAVWQANQRVPKSADFVMQWWDRAAREVCSEKTQLRRFGLVTTNSITQPFNRRVIDRYLNSGLSLTFAVPDHPWTKVSRDAASVRIAMTVGEKSEREGVVLTIQREEGLETDQPLLIEEQEEGRINSGLSIGADVSDAVPLKANEGLSCNGMMLAGQGFRVPSSFAEELVRRDGEQAEKVVRPHIGGSELVGGWSGDYVIDLAELTEAQARQQYPACYAHVLATVKPERDANRRPALKRRWWVFAEPRFTFRPALAGLPRYIATTRTAKHRVFQFVRGDLMPNHEIVAIASADAWMLGVLSSDIHLAWALASGGTLEDRPRYNKGACFDQFPFPQLTEDAMKAIGDLAEELDDTRKRALGEVPQLTLTELYNIAERVRQGEEMDLVRRSRAEASRAAIINRLHEQLDEAVAAAYGWPADLPPSEIVARLVALNAERAAEEAKGEVRWLRPEYQQPRFGAAKS